MVKTCSNNSSPAGTDREDDDDTILIRKRNKTMFDTKQIPFSSTSETQQDDDVIVFTDSNKKQNQSGNDEEAVRHGGELVLVNDNNNNNNNYSTDSTEQPGPLVPSERRDRSFNLSLDDVEVASSSRLARCSSKRRNSTTPNFMKDFEVLRTAIQSMVSPEQKVNLDQIYQVMDQIRKQQLKHMKDAEKYRSEKNSKKTKIRIYIALLVIFVVFFTILNLGAAFGAVYYLQPTKVSSNNELLATKDGEIVSTTTKVVSYTMEGSTFEFNMTGGGNTRRQLKTTAHRILNDFCPTWGEGDNTSAIQCKFVGTMKQSHAMDMFQSFCPSWPSTEQCTGTGVPFIHLSCGNVITKIYGGIYLPPGPPASWTSRQTFTLLPTINQ
jgi:hypothetical protein